jgi:hypothetical protein
MLSCSNPIYVYNSIQIVLVLSMNVHYTLYPSVGIHRIGLLDFTVVKSRLVTTGLVVGSGRVSQVIINTCALCGGLPDFAPTPKFTVDM